LPVQTPAATSALDLAFWNSVRDSANATLFKAYLDKFPNGVFAAIAREKLKTLGSAAVAVAPAPATTAAAVSVPAAPVTNMPAKPQGLAPVMVKAASFVLTKNGLKGINAKTPFSQEVLQKALPDYRIRKMIRQVEGDTEYYFVAEDKRGTPILRFDHYGTNTVTTISTMDKRVSGPSGFHVGDPFGAVRNKVKLQNECLRGAEASINTIICSTPEERFHYVVSIPYEAAREPEVWTLAMIAPATPLKELRWTATEADSAGPGMTATPKPAIRAAGPVLSGKGVGGIDAQTPYTIDAIRAALPGLHIRKAKIQQEVVMVPVLIASADGKDVMVILEGEKHNIDSIKVIGALVTGPSGVRIGDSIAKIRQNIALGECYWGGEEMEGNITCYPENSNISYAFVPPVSMNPGEGDLTPDTISPETRLIHMTWQAPEPDAKPAIPVKPGPTIKPAPSMSIEQLLKQGNAWVKKAQGAQAMAFYLEAARKGSAVAYFDIGTLYESGNGVAKTLKGALDYYNRAVALGYLQAYSRIIIVQGLNKDFKGAARTFFTYYRANPALALQSHQSWSGDILRTIQVIMKNSGHYKGAVDGRFGPETRAAIAAYANGQPATASTPQATPPNTPAASAAERAGDPLARKLQR
jgi:hypothetical protein